MPNPVKPESTSPTSTASKQNPPRAGTTPNQEAKPAMPGRVEPKDGARAVEATKGADQQAPVQVAVEQKSL